MYNQVFCAIDINHFLFGRPLGVFTANDAVSDPITMAQLMTSLANGLMTVYDVAENQSLPWNE